MNFDFVVLSNRHQKQEVNAPLRHQHIFADAGAYWTVSLGGGGRDAGTTSALLLTDPQLMVWVVNVGSLWDVKTQNGE